MSMVFVGVIIFPLIERIDEILHRHDAGQEGGFVKHGDHDSVLIASRFGEPEQQYLGKKIIDNLYRTDTHLIGYNRIVLS